MYSVAFAPDRAWHASKALGKPFELLMVEFLKRRRSVKQVFYEPENFRREYDFAFVSAKDGRTYTAECKCDVMAEKTGRAFIQTGKNGQAHGLLTTRANYWFISIGKDGDNVVCVKPIDLLEHLHQLEPLGQAVKVRQAGRSGNSTGYLISIPKLMECPGLWRLENM